MHILEQSFYIVSIDSLLKQNSHLAINYALIKDNNAKLLDNGTIVQIGCYGTAVYPN